MPEFHDLAELSLNRKGESWGNLGYWQSAEDYSEACRSLAQLLGERAGLDQQSIVFDAGFGCGDQLLLWSEQFRVARILGINLSHSQTRHARKLLAKNPDIDARTNIVQGDIDDPGLWTVLLPDRRPSHFLALDCAYHFPSRVNFFHRAHRELGPDGCLALTDFMLAEERRKISPSRLLLRCVLAMSRIPVANIVPRTLYESQLRQQGFSDIRITDISGAVLPGFGRFYRESRRRSSANHDQIKSGLTARIKYTAISWFLGWAYRHSILRYCVIIAVKPG